MKQEIYNKLQKTRVKLKNARTNYLNYRESYDSLRNARYCPSHIILLEELEQVVKNLRILMNLNTTEHIKTNIEKMIDRINFVTEEGRLHRRVNYPEKPHIENYHMIKTNNDFTHNIK